MGKFFAYKERHGCLFFAAILPNDIVLYCFCHSSFLPVLEAFRTSGLPHGLIAGGPFAG